MFLKLFTMALLTALKEVGTEFSFRICEPISIDMCRGIGYNETSLPNLVGNDLQSDIEMNLQTFSPLIDYMCSTQLKLFLCSAYMPMCTIKIPLSIGPCRGLCQSVRSRCLPVLQGFGFPWPPALDCKRFPKENNHETMCMEGPGETQIHIRENNVYPGPLGYKVPNSGSNFECSDGSNLYVKLQRTGRCARRCDADVLFNQHDKHFAEIWVATLSYFLLGSTIVTALLMLLGYDSKNKLHRLQILMPVFWCHSMVSIGWTVRFVSGRNAAACGYDPLLPNESYLLLDGLSNSVCTCTFILRYLFGMAACAWWAILCLGWHRDLRLMIPDASEHIVLGNAFDNGNSTKQAKNHQKIRTSIKNNNITHNNFARFIAWALPSFQTLVVIIARFVDADELLGACFVGNQSETGLQILVATPLFCYWIFGSINLISGFVVRFRNKEVMENLKTSQVHTKHPCIGSFLFIYCISFALILITVIYEYANIDVSLSVPINQNGSQVFNPLWPRMTRVVMELILGIISCAWVLSPKVSSMYKKQSINRPKKQLLTTIPSMQMLKIRKNFNIAYNSESYLTVHHLSSHSAVGTLQSNQMPTYILESKKCAPHLYVNRCEYKNQQSKIDQTLL